MSKDAATPRAFLIRHGETEWSRSGKFTGKSDIPLLPEGEERVKSSMNAVVGAGRLIDPSKIGRIYCSPRVRATRTLELLLERVTDPESKQKLQKETSETENIAEWGYGDYEGLLTMEIRALRKERGHDKERPWNIWKDGTEGEGSESPEEVTVRLDRVIKEITELQAQAMKDSKNADVIVVAHGHILRAFVKRWLGFPLATHIEMMLEPGGVCGLSYAHGNVEERAVLVGMSFPGN